MKARTMRLRPRHMGLLLAAGALALPAVAEVMTMQGDVGGDETSVPGADGSPVADFPGEAPRSTTATVHDGRLHVQCWQEGAKIIDQDDLRGLSLNAATRQGSVTFKRVGDDQPSVFILPFADGLCLIQPAR